MIIEDTPLTTEPEVQDPRATQVIVVLGKSESSLRYNL